MSDDPTTTAPEGDAAYEPPVIETIGSAEELAKGNEGSTVDGVPA